MGLIEALGNSTECVCPIYRVAVLHHIAKKEELTLPVLQERLNILVWVR